ncbi:MAG: cyclic lactone autoinducer peptide [Bacilli bacterium]|nr:cyclic lactone autoinducer peptide [Bacilli bacterium]MDD4282213.1 cyclic lactone autoinducer peptide [Bacilli bacterium]MDD4718212.1 cyclic lactone autoinducer peptide [Bacilli bacterium]
MNKIIAGLLSFVGFVAANGFSTACMFLWLDEPEMPENLIK